MQRFQDPDTEDSPRMASNPAGNGCRIGVLPDLLVNKIAAGEVVERPASVVKELVDNALDAGATRISVAIEDGGKQLIRVTDDGFGMTAEDLRLAVMPHATSKIGSDEDLYAISTMGFRGEALASISAVSKLRIVSRVPEAVEGNELRVAGKELVAAQAAGCPAGTTIEVRDLFFNVPARRKFLRAKSTEVGHINEQIARVGLAFPDIGFELTNNGRVTHNLPPSAERMGRIAKFYSPELAEALIRVERDERGVALEAFLAPPAQSRATAQWQYTFVNGRYIRDRYVQHAIKEAYRGLTEPNRHGVVFLFLTVDPHEVDVNVHPTKIEVRWADSNLIHSQVLSALRETLRKGSLPAALRPSTSPTPIEPAEQDRIRREAAMSLKALSPLRPSDPPKYQRLESAASTGRAMAEDRYPGKPGVDPTKVWKSLYGEPGNVESTPAEHAGTTTDVSTTMFPPATTARPRAIQLHELYLVTETDDGIVIIDQHALHERVIYEQLRDRITSGPLEAQRLLLPETVNVTSSQIALLETHGDLLRSLGIEATPLGSDTIAVHAFPSLLKDTDVVSFFRDLLDFLAIQPATVEGEAVLHEVLDMMACKAAVKAGDVLTDGEIDALMRKRHLIEGSSSCPHGRPTMLHLTKRELDRQFKRT